MSVSSQLKRVRQLKTRIHVQRFVGFILLGSEEVAHEKLSTTREGDTVYIKHIVLTHT